MNAAPARRRVTLIHNPTAGRRRGALLDETVRQLVRRGARVNVLFTQRPGDAEAYARDLREAPVDVLVAAGGDGTVNEVCNGMVGAELPLALVPLGTANVLAAELGLPDDPVALAEIILAGAVRRIYLGRANGRYFAAMAGTGFDAWVVAGVRLGLKRRFGKGAYALETLRRLVRPPPLDYRVTVDGRSWPAASVVACNGRHYAGRYVLAPGARLGAPELHACLFRYGARRHLARYILATLAGRAARLPDVAVIPARRLEVSGPPGPVQLDGDALGRLPLVVEAGAARIPVLVG